VLPELTLNNGNDENEDTGDENKNTSENEEWNEDEVTERETTEEKTDIIEKNKTTVHPFVVSMDTGETLIPDEKLSENSTLIKVMITIIIRIFMQK